MPLYYETAAPSQGDKNSITNTATNLGLRDFLLHKNIQDPIRYPQLQTSYNGSPRGGEPFLDTVQGTNSVIQQVSIETDGIFRYGSAIAMNLFRNTDSNSAGQLIDVENIPSIPIFPTPPTGTIEYSQEDLSKYGLLAKSDYQSFRKLATLKNLYLDAPSQIDMADIVSLQPLGTNQQMGSYLDEYGNLNIGDVGATQAADVVGSILNGQGIGFAQGGVVTNYDVRASLAGRVLTATGLLTDTKLGVIGGQQLALALANNAAFNVEQQILGTFNVSDNILSLVKGNGLAGLRPNYTITVPSSTGGQILTYAERVLGFYVPRSFLDAGGSIFSSENGNVANIERANSMLNNTGQGQLKVLTDLMNSNLQATTTFKTGYAPGFQQNGNNIINPILYAYYNNGNILNVLNPTISGDTIPDITYNRSKMIDDNFPAPTYATGNQDYYGNTLGSSNSHIKTPTFSWGSNSNDVNIVNTATNFSFIPNPDKKTLLGKTQLLFNSKGMKTIVSSQGDVSGVGIAGSQIQTSVFKGSISKGSAVLTSNNFNSDGSINSKATTGSTASNTYCRTWTTYNRYDTVSKLIRSRGVNQAENTDGTDILGTPWRQNYKNGSVLGDNGFVQIGPYVSDDLTRQADNPKKYMFSIENLAWVGNPALNLPAVEQGPGDLLTGKFGRIMWFPPYDLTFNETSSVSLESNLFIGRGEPLYTYNNTERSGNLSFKVIVDHPSIMNSFQGNNVITDEFVNSWLSGCLDLNSQWSDLLTNDEKAFQANRNALKVTPVTVTPVTIQPQSFKIYFKNDSTDVDPEYEAVPANQPAIEQTYTSNIQIQFKPDANGNCNPVPPQNTTWTDPVSAGLNSTAQPLTVGTQSFPDSWTDTGFFPALNTYLNSSNFQNYSITITVAGFASSQGCLQQNLILATGRRDMTIAYLKEQLTGNIKYTSVPVDNSSIGQMNNGNYTNNPNTSPQSGIGPKSDRYSMITFSINYLQTQTTQPVQAVDSNTVLNLNPAIKKRFYNEGIFFEKLKREDPFVFDKISQKLRYFNPAFHSITPEGFNSRLTFLLQCTRQGPTIQSVQPNNLSFGPPPVCILRIGDFYNTKIMIDNINLDFQEPQWDLNPEGIGVQPMIATVNISFKYIGGSSLQSPINKLQNALSFNYFANTQMYEPRSDYVARASDVNATNNNNNFADKRNTFDSNTLENNYALVLGMDSTSVPYETDPTAVPTNTANDTVNVDQVKTAAASNNTVQTSLTNATQDNSVLSLPSSQIHLTTQNGVMGLAFNIVKNVSNNLSQNYGIEINVQEQINPQVNYFFGVGNTQVTPNNQNTNIFVPLSSFTSPIPSSILTDSFNYILIVTLTGEDGNILTPNLKGNINKT